MLRRIDYVTDVLGGVGAQYTYDLKAVEGITFRTCAGWSGGPRKRP